MSNILTIYLIKKSIEVAKDIVKDSDALSYQALFYQGEKLGELFISKPNISPPKWAHFFEGFVPPDNFGQTSYPGAILLIEVGERKFAVTFGQGWHLLAEGCYEEGYGFKIGLNSIGENQLRAISKSSFDTLLTRSQVQSTYPGAESEFGINWDKDIVSGVAGASGIENFGKKITGKDSLHINIPIKLPELKNLLQKSLKTFRSNDYRKKFPNVEKKKKISEKKLITTLDNYLLGILKKQLSNDLDLKRVSLIIPKMIKDWESISEFCFEGITNKKTRVGCKDLNLDIFQKSCEQEITLSLLRRKKVLCLGECLLPCFLIQYSENCFFGFRGSKCRKASS